MRHKSNEVVILPEILPPETHTNNQKTKQKHSHTHTHIEWKHKPNAILYYKLYSINDIYYILCAVVRI